MLEQISITNLKSTTYTCTDIPSPPRGHLMILKITNLIGVDRFFYRLFGIVTTHWSLVHFNFFTAQRRKNVHYIMVD